MLSAAKKALKQSKSVMIKFKLVGFGKSETTKLSPLPRAAPAFQYGIQANLSGKRVLIVDDDPVFLQATATKLQLAGCRVRTAQESSEAIAALSEQPVDAVLMDINFPPDVCNGGMGSWDGFQMLNWLRGLGGAQGARFIMVSNSDSASDRQRAQKLGAVAYLQKPLDHDLLFAVLNASN